MIRTIIIMTVFLLTAGNCFGQGLLDSVLGPGGLGVWGSNQNISTPNYGPYGSGAPDAQYQPPQPQQYPPQSQAQTPMHPGYNQPGVYGDWQNYPPAVTGTPDQMQYPASADGSPVQQQAPPQYQAQQQQYQRQAPQAQGGRPLSWQAPPGQPQPQAAQRSQAMQGQAQPQQGPPQVSADDLPAGAVRITTTTPDGTSVEYYPPAGEPMYGPQQAPAMQPQPQQQPAQPRRLKHKQAKEQKPAQASPSRGPIAMPKPVPMPQNQDPRYGWGVAPSAPE